MSQQNVDAVKRIYELGAESWRRLRIHHYGSKSEEEAERKAQQWRSATVVFRRYGPPTGSRGQLDETLTAYGPPVREAIERSSRRE